MEINKEEFLKSPELQGFIKNLEILKFHILHNYPFRFEFLKEYVPYIDWNWALWNQNIDWSVQHIELIKNEIQWKLMRNEILRNPKIASNQDIILHYFDQLSERNLYENGSILWDEYLIEKLSNKIDLSKLSQHLMVSADFIEKHKAHLDWDNLSRNRRIDWSPEFIKKNKALINWKNLSFNHSLNWNEELLFEFRDLWDWHSLSQNYKVNWTTALIDKYQEKLDWGRLSYNPHVNFTIPYVEGNKDKIDFHGLSRNTKIEWSEAFISKYEADLNFSNYGLSWNFSLPWNKELIAKYKDKWSWSGISANRGIPWTEEILDYFSEELIWGQNDHIEQNSADESHRRNGFCLSNNPNLPWSLALINRYKNRFLTHPSNKGIWEKILVPILTEEKVKVMIGVPKT